MRPTMSGYWVPKELVEFDYQIAGANGNSTTYPSAIYWAATEWYPRVIGSMVVSSLIPLLAAYEFFIHLPTEVTIWWRLSQRKRTKRGVMPFAILWLRYGSLALGIMYAVIIWDPEQTIDTCMNIIWPIEGAFLGIISMSIAVVNAWRSRTTMQAAVQSKRKHVLIRILCIVLLLARLVAFVTAIAYAREWFRFFVVFQGPGQLNPRTTCAGMTTALEQYFTNLPKGSEFANIPQPPNYVVTILLATIVASDFALAIITLASIFRLSRDIRTRSTFIASLFNNSIMFYSMLILFDLAGVVYFTVTKDGVVTPLITIIASVLTVRVLINEQETILAANLHSHANRTRRLATRGGDPRSTIAWTTQHNNQNGRGGQAASPFIIGRRWHRDNSQVDMQRVPAAVRPLARPSDVYAYGDSDARYVRGPFDVFGVGRHWQKPSAVRQRGGLTDIERVTVLEEGRSVDRPWPQWEDEDEEYFEECAPDRGNATEILPQGDAGALQSLVRNWWRDVDRDPLASQPPMLMSARQEAALAAATNGNDAVRGCEDGMEMSETAESCAVMKQKARLDELRSRPHSAGVNRHLEGTMKAQADEASETDSCDETGGIDNHSDTSDEPKPSLTLQQQLSSTLDVGQQKSSADTSPPASVA